MDPGKAAQLASVIHGTDFSKVPQSLEIDPEEITGQVHAYNSACESCHDPLAHELSPYLGPDERTRVIFKSLVRLEWPSL